MTSKLHFSNHISINYPIEFYLWNQKKSACIREISPEGVFLQSEELFSPGVMLTLRMDLPQVGCRFTVLGKVVPTPNVALHSAASSTPSTVGPVEVSKEGMYVVFVDISPSNRERIHTYVTTNQESAVA